MSLAASLSRVVRVMAAGIGLHHQPPPIVDEPAITEMRAAERRVRVNSVMISRGLRTSDRDARAENLAALQQRLRENV